MEKGPQRAHGCHRVRWEQCRSERSRRDIREKYRGRAHRSPSSGRVQPRTPYLSKHRSPHEVDAVRRQLCVHVVSARSRCTAGKLQVGYPERQPHHPHQEGQQQGSSRTYGSSRTAKYVASFIVRPNETFVNPAYQTSFNFDNVFTGALPDLVIVGLVSDADLAGGYQRNPLNFKNFGVNRIELKRNGTSRPSEFYTPNFANGQYIKAYMTFFQGLEADTNDKSVSLTPSE